MFSYDLFLLSACICVAPTFFTFEFFFFLSQQNYHYTVSKVCHTAVVSNVMLNMLTKFSLLV